MTRLVPCLFLDTTLSVTAASGVLILFHVKNAFNKVLRSRALEVGGVGIGDASTQGATLRLFRQRRRQRRRAGPTNANAAVLVAVPEPMAVGTGKEGWSAGAGRRRRSADRALREIHCISSTSDWRSSHMHARAPRCGLFRICAAQLKG